MTLNDILTYGAIWAGASIAGTAVFGLLNWIRNDREEKRRKAEDEAAEMSAISRYIRLWHELQSCQQAHEKARRAHRGVSDASAKLIRTRNELLSLEHALKARGVDLAGLFSEAA